MICGTQSDGELRKVQKMGNKQGGDNTGKKPHTEQTSNLRQAAPEDCEAFPRCGDTREVNFPSHRSLKGKKKKFLLEFFESAIFFQLYVLFWWK